MNSPGEEALQPERQHVPKLGGPPLLKDGSPVHSWQDSCHFQDRLVLLFINPFWLMAQEGKCGPLSGCWAGPAKAAGFQSGLDLDPANSRTDWVSLGESLCPVDLCVRHEIGEPRVGCSWTEQPLGEAPGFLQAWVFGILWPLGLGFSKCKVGVGTFVSELPQREAIDQMLQG